MFYCSPINLVTKKDSLRLLHDMFQSHVEQAFTIQWILIRLVTVNLKS